MMRILVIDDDVTLLWSLSNTLRRWGSSVEAATGARAGVRKLADKPFDVIILDYRMPDHDAVWFLQHANIPDETHVIVMSGYVDMRGLEALRRMGAGNILEKPFSEAELENRLHAISMQSAWRQQAEAGENRKGKKHAKRLHAARAEKRAKRSHRFGVTASHAA